MHRFWTNYTRPILETVRPQRMWEIGAEFGTNTRALLEYCQAHGAQLDVIDPAPAQSLLDLFVEFPDHRDFHRAKSFDVIERLQPADIVLLDGDHNWHTVHTELVMIYARSAKAGVPPPIILAHDCAWPYARRDMYYDPDSILEHNRHPYAYRGMAPGVTGLTDSGLNSTFANALVEGGPKNGVLTALEDFVAASPHEITFKTLPFHNGYGILIPKVRMTNELRSVVEGFYTAESLMAALISLEHDTMNMRVEHWQVREQLTRRTQALERARALLAEKKG